MFSPPLWILCVVLSTASLSLTASVNVTIDDTSPNITYSSPPQTLGRCTPQTCSQQTTPAPFNGTSTIADGNATVEFVGTGVAVSLGINGTARFFIDGTERGSFLGTSMNELVEWAFDVGQMAPHELVIVGNNTAPFQLDRIVYMQDLPPSSASHSTPVGPIVGGVLGGIAIVVLVVFVGIHRRRHQRRSASAKRRMWARNMPWTADAEDLAGKRDIPLEEHARGG
ncbi:hypothetical protein MKEN_00752400 [Mycena kentingensis (nom. inval.)]|nr:hypothetical protein MKEN_00752400 [Mycena kentingensis (nom. inval.)]